MFSFEGDYRRKPVQSLGGVSKQQQRESLIQRAQIERVKRQELRKQNQSAIIIQAFIRGCRDRRALKSLLRQDFEQISSSQTTQIGVTQITELMNKLCFFFNVHSDASKLVWLSQHVVKNATDLMRHCQNTSSFTFCLARFLNLTLQFINYYLTAGQADGRDPLGTHWRVLEIFLNISYWKKNTDMSTAETTLGFIFGILVKKGYFDSLRQIIDAKIPPLVEPTVRAPSPLSACFFEFLLQPLEFAATTTSCYSKAITVLFSKAFLEAPYSEPVAYFILPSLGKNKEKIPLVLLLQTNETASKNPWLLHSLLMLADGHPLLGMDQNLHLYIATLSQLTGCLQFMRGSESQESDEDSDEEEMDTLYKAAELEVMSQCVDILNGPTSVHFLVSALHTSRVLPSLCTIAHNLLLSDRMALHKYRLLYTLAFRPSFLRQLLTHIRSEKQVSLFGSSDTSLIALLSKGVTLSPPEIQRIVPLLDVFCSLFSHLLVTLDDCEFFNESGSIRGAMPFTLPEMVELASSLRDVCIGLVELAYPDTRPSGSSFSFAKARSTLVNEEETRLWMHLFKSTVNLARQLHTRDTRRQFCPSWAWETGRVALPLERNGQLSLRRQGRQQRPFRVIRPMTRSELEEEGSAMLSTRDIRTLSILREIPFVFSFTDRVKMWQQWIMGDKIQQQNEANFLRGPSIQVMIRRNYIYEDAFDKLSLDNEPNLRLKMRVQLTNAVGLDEAGIDGGGIFREFLSELLKTSFDPNRGFFRLTHDNLLYPNPGVAVLHPDFPKHYYFIGRMLGKALYENLLVELPLADFFLSKLLGQASASLDVHHLASLDPVLHKNLLSLRHYDGDVTELGLDFTIVSSELGETRVEELKPNGCNIPVTSSNRIEYIHLVADYKLNKQIRLQCNAFRQGLANVIDLEWLQTFSCRELQVLISGAYAPVDVEDLRSHTHYSGGYTPTHPVIQHFWKVVAGFDDRRKRQLLKFVTSCSRPPLLGFRELDPPFCIQNAGTEDRLPTASTCMNLLKLPEFSDENILRDKLLYALESGAGFELS